MLISLLQITGGHDFLDGDDDNNDLLEDEEGNDLLYTGLNQAV